MKKPGFSRRDFVSAGSVLAASAVVSTVSCQAAGLPAKRAEEC